MSRFLLAACCVAVTACGGSSAPGAATAVTPPPTSSPSLSVVHNGELLLRLTFPRLHLNIAVVQGTNASAMQAGAGHYEQTPLPGSNGNVVLLGDPTFFGRPFARLNQAKPGDSVTITTRDGHAYQYKVVPAFNGHANPWTLPADDTSYLSQSGSLAQAPWLTLATLARGSARRVIVRLKLAG